MPETTYNELLASARDMAARAGLVIMDRWRSASVRTKSDGSPVTDADLAAQDRIVRAIGQRYPDHDVLAEEAGPADRLTGKSSYCWVIDPLDGTRNYARGFPCFATSIGLLADGQPVMGVVREQVTGMEYCAVAGGGATADGVAVKVARRPLDREFFVGVHSVQRGETPEAIKRVVDRVNMRNTGSAALHLALVATGALDAAFGRRCHAWDIAAGYVLVAEAGGLCTSVDGRPLLPLPPTPDPRGRTPFLAAGPHAHGELLDILRSPEAEGATPTPR